jgi:hypothetical protein
MVTPITLGFRAATTRVVFKPRSNLNQRITNGDDEVAEIAKILLMIICARLLKFSLTIIAFFLIPATTRG